MASHAIFQYNVLAIDDIHNTWTNMIVKMTILRLLGSSDDKEKIGVARPKGPPLRGFRYPVSGRGSRGSRPSQVSGQRPESSSVRSTGRTDGPRKGHRCIGRPLYQRRCQVPRRSVFSTGSTDGASVHTTGVMTSAPR